MGASSSGKCDHQKLKSYLVLQLLQQKTDEEHVLTAIQIAAELSIKGIQAERRGIYRDIKEINTIFYMLENQCSLQEAGEAIDDSEYGEEEKTIVYDAKRKGFYMKQHKYDLLDLRLLAECAYSSRFLTESQSRHLIDDVICEYASEYQRKQITHDAFLTDRVKTSNKAVLRNLEKINNAMTHNPEKIKVVYLKRVMKPDGIHMTEKTIILSPQKLMINDGYYYLLAYSGKRLGTWRVDRIKEVIPIGEPRDCDDSFSKFDLSNYAQCNFGMMINTKKIRVKLICDGSLLDTMYDRFGAKGIYNWIDENHFSCEPLVEFNHQFYGWICGFGENIKIATPEIAERYSKYLSRIQAMY